MIYYNTSTCNEGSLIPLILAKAPGCLSLLIWYDRRDVTRMWRTVNSSENPAVTKAFRVENDGTTVVFCSDTVDGRNPEAVYPATYEVKIPGTKLNLLLYYWAPWLL